MHNRRGRAHRTPVSVHIPHRGNSRVRRERERRNIGMCVRGIEGEYRGDIIVLRVGRGHHSGGAVYRGESIQFHDKPLT